MDLDMFFNETTGEFKFFRGGAARTGLGPEWDHFGVATINFTVYGAGGYQVPVPREHIGGGPKPDHLLGHPKQ